MLSRTLVVSWRFRCVEVALYMLAGTLPDAMIDDLADIAAECGAALLGGGAT